MDTKGRFDFRRGGSISQRRGFFAAKGHFCSLFRSYQMRSLCCEMALVCQRVVSQLRNTMRNGALAAKLGVFTLWDFAAILQLRNEVTVLRSGTRVPRASFAAVKIFAEKGMRLRNDFAAKWRFRSEGLISQRTFWDCEIS